MKDKRKKRDATAFLSPRGRVPLEKHPRDVNIDRKTRLCARLCARPHDFRGQNIDIFRQHQALLAFVFAVQKQRKCAQKFPGTFPPDANVHPPRRLDRTARGDEIDESLKAIAPFFFLLLLLLPRRFCASWCLELLDKGNSLKKSRLPMKP